MAAAIAIVLALLAASPAQAGRYVVRWGDTLTWIAQAHHVGLHRLARMNHRHPYAVLVAGTVLHVPGRTHSRHARATYTVQWGDTLSAIAGRYHVSLRSLARANDLRPRGLLISGTSLRIPGHWPGSRPCRAAHHARPHVHRRTGAGWRGRYRVHRGDTLTAIGRRFGVGLHRLARANGLHVHALLITGTRLRVPAHATRAHTTAPAAQAAGALVGRLVDRPLERPLRRRRPSRPGRRLAGVGVAPPSRLGRRRVGRHAGDAGDMGFVEDGVIGVPVAHTPDGGVRVGVAFLRHLLVGFGGNVRLAVAAYYQGETATRMFGVLPISKPYVANVMALRTRL